MSFWCLQVFVVMFAVSDGGGDGDERSGEQDSELTARTLNNSKNQVFQRTVPGHPGLKYLSTFCRGRRHVGKGLLSIGPVRLDIRQCQTCGRPWLG